jgi:hypothetical protein
VHGHGGNQRGISRLVDCEFRRLRASVGRAAFRNQFFGTLHEGRHGIDTAD